MENGISQSLMAERDKIERAACFVSRAEANENPERGDTLHSVNALMMQRRECAREWLRNPFDESRSQLKEIIDLCNDKIKQALGL